MSGKPLKRGVNFLELLILANYIVLLYIRIDFAISVRLTDISLFSICNIL